MYDFKFADIGEGIHEGQILKWMFQVGDKVKEGDTLCLIETDKVNAEIPSPVSGVIKKLGGAVGDTIHVGNTLALIDDGSSAQPAKKDTAEAKPIQEGEENSAGVVGQIEVSSEVIESSTESYQKADVPTKRVLATPVARQLAKDLGVDINKVTGTGEMGRVTKEDIYKIKESTSKQSIAKEEPIVSKPISFKMPETTSADVTRVPITKIRKTIVKNMVISKSVIPHTTVMDELDVTNLVNFRTEQKELALSKGVKLTYMPFIIKAVVLALKDYPVFNSSFDHEKEEIIYKHFYNIGLAVDTPDGLIVPNIKHADRKSIIDVAKELQVLSEEANNRTIQLDKLQNGTFTITNYGIFGSTFGAPVIKHPEVAILGVGMIAKKPIVRNNEIVIADIMPLSLSIDHRIIDGGDAGRFMMRVKEYLTNPMLLLLS
ncbi:MAG TPA: dihydrolipoamide acetyltransferase family protein [Bacilli bacterium]|nr:dihydrolipoamide acetyltransferase family protein [Bacilli bacterium]